MPRPAAAEGPAVGRDRMPTVELDPLQTHCRAATLVLPLRLRFERDDLPPADAECKMEFQIVLAFGSAGEYGETSL